MKIENIKKQFKKNKYDKISFEEFPKADSLFISIYSGKFIFHIHIYLDCDKKENSFLIVYENRKMIYNKVMNYKKTFSTMRNFTKKESKKYEKLLSKLYKPTGVNFFDLLKG